MPMKSRSISTQATPVVPLPSIVLDAWTFFHLKSLDGTTEYDTGYFRNVQYLI